MRPQIYIENFVMDMAIASDTTTEYYKTLLKAYDSLPNKDFDGDGQSGTEEDWQTYLRLNDYDNSTSGYCYFTNGKPS